MKNLETIAKKLAEISANYTFGNKTLDEVIRDFNSNSELKIQIYEGMGKDIDIAHSISDIYDSCTIEAFVKILNNSKQDLDIDGVLIIQEMMSKEEMNNWVNLFLQRDILNLVIEIIFHLKNI